MLHWKRGIHTSWPAVIVINKSFYKWMNECLAWMAQSYELLGIPRSLAVNLSYLDREELRILFLGLGSNDGTLRTYKDMEGIAYRINSIAVYISWFISQLCQYLRTQPNSNTTSLSSRGLPSPLFAPFFLFFPIENGVTDKNDVANTPYQKIYRLRDRWSNTPLFIYKVTGEKQLFETCGSWRVCFCR